MSNGFSVIQFSQDRRYYNFADFRYNSLIILKVIGFCCLEGEIGVSSDLRRIVIKRRALLNN